jgi:hypothetical protein
MAMVKALALSTLISAAPPDVTGASRNAAATSAGKRMWRDMISSRVLLD